VSFEGQQGLSSFGEMQGIFLHSRFTIPMAEPRYILITGGNTGLGYHAAKSLLQKGYGVILACRDAAKAEAAKSKLKGETQNPQVQVLQLDLASLASIRQAAEALKTPLYGLINNAGVSVTRENRLTQDGFEETVGVNHLGHFLLTNLLLVKHWNSLKRIVIVSSDLHNPEKSNGRFPAPHFSSFDELFYPDKSANADAGKAGSLHYVHSKLCNLFFAHGLINRLKQKGMTEPLVNALSPGFVPTTGLVREESAGMRFMLRRIMPLMKFMIPAIESQTKAGENIARLITDVTESGKYYDRSTEEQPSALSRDKKRIEECWTESAKAVGLKAEETLF
jgi:NAD(P)-dependent dehydrogenase (short-subunit alcohol dehydrogenase family)